MGIIKNITSMSIKRELNSHVKTT